MRRIYIFTGHYGSGKTEIAVNFARMLNKKGERKTAIIDMDIINPFFRTADAKGLMESEGIRVELPIYANTNVDMPALTGTMGGIINDPEYDVVLDIGGDDLGAKALGYYAPQISAQDHILYFTVNPYRPFTEDPEGIAEVFKDIENASGLKITGLVNNSNLLEQTTPEIFEKGYKTVYEASQKLGIPLILHTAFCKTYNALALKYPLEEPSGPYDIPCLPKIMGASFLPMEECVKLLWDRNSGL